MWGWGWGEGGLNKLFHNQTWRHVAQTTDKLKAPISAVVYKKIRFMIIRFIMHDSNVAQFIWKKNKVNVHTERPCKQDHFVLYIQDTGFIQKKKDPNFYLSFRYFCENLISSTSISTSRLWQFFFSPSSCVSYRSVCRKWKGGRHNAYHTIYS